MKIKRIGFWTPLALIGLLVIMAFLGVRLYQGAMIEDKPQQVGMGINDPIPLPEERFEDADLKLDILEEPVDYPAPTPEFSKPFFSDLDAMIERRVIRVLVAYNQTSFFLNEGGPQGFEYELMQQYREHLKTRVKPQSWPVMFLYVPVPVNRLIPDLIEGRGDIAIGGITITDERAAQVNFTTPYLEDVREVVVTNKDAAPLGSLDDLSGLEIYLDPSTSFTRHLETLNQRFKDEGKAAARLIAAPEWLASEDILQMVNAGIVSTTIVDEHVAKLWAQVLPNITLQENAILHDGGQIAWAVRKENPELLASLNSAMGEIRKGSFMGNLLFSKYFEKRDWIENPLTTARLDNLREIGDLLRKYGEQYQIDWVVLAALAFQESRFDQSAESHKGAVGVMQVLPETAQSVEIDDISGLENNIHAGVKYLAYLRDTFFNEPEITPEARNNFLLAAYNAGPYAIARMRKLTERAGLDPNKWFSNVERITRRYIGRETVEYVANIKKYYVAYSLILHSNKLRREQIDGVINDKSL